MDRLDKGPLALLERSPAGKTLDIPAGAGLESAALCRLGHEVFAVDLFFDRGGDGGFRVCADANQAFPFQSEVFDYILSREGIEHFENQASFLRECSRVLKPGGLLVVTTPNTMHLSARASYFLTGQRVLSRGLANEIQTLRGTARGRHYHGHIFLIDYFRMRYLLRLSDFGELAFFTDRYSLTSLLLAWITPLLYGASLWSIRLSRRRAQKRSASSPPAVVLREILRHVFSPALLFGKRMIVTARRLPTAPTDNRHREPKPSTPDPEPHRRLDQ